MTTTNKDVAARGRRRLTNNYRQAEIAIARGEGCWLFDVEGKKYLDLCAGVAVCSLGHAHPALAQAIAEQAKTLVHCSNLYFIERQVALAERLTEATGFARAFFCNSGVEAVESAVKLARRYMQVTGKAERVEIVAAEGSFHGRTFAGITLTGQPKYRDKFGPLFPDVRHVPYGDLGAMRAAVGDRTCAILIEPVQGEGGVVPAPDGYLAGLRALCDERGAFLLFDEVQTGMGRCGYLLASEHWKVRADAVAVAKGIAGGFPMGAMLATEEAARGFEPGAHASTFGGNPLACAAALAVQRVFAEQRILDRVKAAGTRLSELLAGLARQHPGAIRGERGLGLLRGLVLDPKIEAARVVAGGIERGVLVSSAGGNVVRFSPPLIVTDDELADGVRRIGEAIGAIAKA